MLRAREIVPRLRNLRAAQAGFDLIGARALRAHWWLGDGARLTLIANFGDTPVSGGPAPAGDLLYAVPEFSGTFDGHCPAWSVVWFLDRSAGART